VELIQGGIELIPPLPLNPFGVISLNPLTSGNMFGKQGIIQGLRCGKIQKTEKKIDPYIPASKHNAVIGHAYTTRHQICVQGALTISSIIQSQKQNLPPCR
jgi:hypothetical protein